MSFHTHKGMNIIFHGKLGVVKGFDVGALPPLKTCGELSLNYEIFLHLLCVCAVIYKMGKKKCYYKYEPRRNYFCTYNMGVSGEFM
jgi:hypothetical protein